MNPVFMEDLFHETKWLIRRLYNIEENAPKTVKYGKSI